MRYLESVGAQRSGLSFSQINAHFFWEIWRSWSEALNGSSLLLYDFFFYVSFLQSLVKSNPDWFDSSILALICNSK